MSINYFIISLVGGILWCIGFLALGYMVKRLWAAIVISLVLVTAELLICKSASHVSEKLGAYKQLRGEYTLVYHVDDQGNICDTVIVEVE